MSSISNDAEDLRQFSLQLTQFQDAIYNATLEMTNRFKSLGETWADPQYDRFAERIQDFNQKIFVFLTTTETVPEDLNALALKIEKYSSQR